jgi:hypothetical protein
MKPRSVPHFLQVVRALALVSGAGSTAAALTGCGALAPETEACPAAGCPVDASAPDGGEAGVPVPVLGTDAGTVDEDASIEVLSDAPYDGFILGVGPPPPVPPPSGGGSGG